MCINMTIFVLLLTVTTSLATAITNFDGTNNEHNYGEDGIELILNVNSQRVKSSNWDWIPTLSQLKSAVQAIIAAGDKEVALGTQRQFLKDSSGVPLTAVATVGGRPVGGAVAAGADKIMHHALGSDEKDSMESDKETHDLPKSFNGGSLFDSVLEPIGGALLGAL